MTTLTRWVLKHKRVVVAFWLILAVVGFASAQSATNALSQTFSLPGKESYEVNLKILHTYGTDPSNTPFVPVITLPAGVTVRSPGVKSQIARAFARIGAYSPGSRMV